jgi:hypothetical protein
MVLSSSCFTFTTRTEPPPNVGLDRIGDGVAGLSTDPPDAADDAPADAADDGG